MKEAAIRGTRRPHIAIKVHMYGSSNIIDCHQLFIVGKAEVPVKKELHLIGKDGKLVGILAIFDDGAMVNTIDTVIFTSV